MAVILQIIPALGAGGAEQACVDITAGLVKRGDRALMVSSGGWRVPEIENAGGQHLLHAVNSKNPIRVIANAFWLKHMITIHKVDIVHARSRAPAWSAWLACRMTGCHFMTTFHADYRISNPIKKLYNSVMTIGERVIAISRFIADSIVTKYATDPNKVRLVYRGISLSRFDPTKITPESRAAIRHEWCVDEQTPVVLLPARLSFSKGHSLLINALQLLRNHVPTIHAVIIGDDQGRKHYRRELEDLIESCGLHATVHLLDHCTDMPLACAAADVVVVPSLIPEGFGRVPVEAMAMGTPVIASAVGATIETVIDGETGWLLPLGDPAKWAETILRAVAMSDADRAVMAEKAIAHVRAHFSDTVMVKDTLAVYDELLVK